MTGWDAVVAYIAVNGLVQLARIGVTYAKARRAAKP